MTELECALEENKKLRILDAEKTARIAHLELLVDKLTFELAALKRVTFGQKTEASDALASDLFGDPTLGLETQVNPDAAVQPAPLKKVSSQAKAPPRITLPSDLPVEEVELDLAESEKFAADGTALKCIGVEISDKLAVTPSRFFIRRTKRFKYAHPGQEELGVKTAPLHQIIPGGIADASVYADVLIKKFDDHLPLNRISEIYLRDGKVNLSKQTLSDWVLTCASWLTPLCEALKKALLQESVIHVDETVLPLLHPVKTINARAWVYVGGGGKLLYYQFTTDKKGVHVRETLKDWNPVDGKRYLQADAASNYDGLYRQGKVLELGCWVRSRVLAALPPADSNAERLCRRPDRMRAVSFSILRSLIQWRKLRTPRSRKSMHFSPLSGKVRRRRKPQNNATNGGKKRPSRSLKSSKTG